METIDYEKELKKVKKDAKKEIKKIKKKAKKDVKKAQDELEWYKVTGFKKMEEVKEEIDPKKCAWPSCENERMDENSLLCKEHDAEYKEMIRKAGDTVTHGLTTIFGSLFKDKEKR